MNEFKNESDVLRFTPQARAAILAVMQDHQLPEGTALRVGVKSAGCSTQGYLLGFDTPKPDDDQYRVDGFHVIMDKRHSLYVMGMEIDYVETEGRRGFVFNNPRMKSE